MLATRPPPPGALCRAPRALLSRRALLAAPTSAAPASGPGPASSGPLGPSPSSIDYINPAYFYANPFAPAQGAPSSSSAPGSSGPAPHATALRTIDSVVAAASAARAAATARAAVAARSASPSPSSAIAPSAQLHARAPSASAAAAHPSSASATSSSSTAAAAFPSTPAASTAPVQLSPAAAAALATSTFASMDEGDGPVGAPGGVRLLVVVGVVLLDDPQWDHETGEPSLKGAAAADRPVRVLLAQRPVGKSNAGLWEFPGGKVDPGETPEAALVRELREELGIAVDPSDLAPLTFASHTYPTFHLLMPLYACRRWSGVPVGAEGQAVAWAAAGEVTSFNLTPADIPLVPAVLAAMRHYPSP
ncbi:hypothetical protein HXX76_015973 [Chlamydomonas incerta]|uniref:8-oxo-dGTP diphosphatase n=1 Tax=Chlamydomonas incerta TaxID=51695 RepID=A0A835VR61_CHLIN|nr:hypothetical protein HXX76_015973 [Chlamydomonas incerta]|eukprot:KAG2422504.1 hypothetical protein HXX76_015973 [Chlamydomonas incerta]